MSLFNQLKIPSAISGVLVIALYLGGLQVLHVTTPALFTMEAFNKTTDITVTKTPAIQDLSLYWNMYV